MLKRVIMTAGAAMLLTLTIFVTIVYGFNSANFIRETNEEWIYSSALSDSQVRTAKISAVGDLMVHTRQAEDALRKGNGSYDYDYSFSYIKNHFMNSDIVVGNLETVLGGPEIGFRDFPLFNITDEFAYALKNAGFNLLATGNNHSLDQREAGLLRTIEKLQELGIPQFGTYASQEERDEILIIEINGISFAFLCYSYSTNGIPIPAGKNYLINMLDEQLFIADIQRARAMNPDFIIVMPHMGTEYESHVRGVHRNTVMRMFEAGADIVLAHHPHVVQPAEFITIIDEDGTERLCFVAFSMGNFISGQRTRPRDAGVIFNLYFEKIGDQKAALSAVSYIPTWVKFYHKGSSIDIAIKSVHDILTTHMWGGDTGLSQNDINRVRNVQVETTQTISGTAVPVERLAAEYFLLGGNLNEQ